MKVRVTWMHKNPFVPRLEDLFRGSEADLPDDTSFETIERYAKEATPEGFWLKLIQLPTEKHEYFYDGTKKVIQL
ncbi:hypothetical protein D0T84_14065 [Dysgonomonas sp. 521]|uniref:hypothetical protein n=1 Tax=Dysgonomonas sp. 521 TaxID=2302932 RepID=UPI0013D6BF96|nr:hypothetical protein [Dysgonomonas sp. 521]NDV96030.1 hypothetical protein [Dysgonomonas sp. 521]